MQINKLETIVTAAKAKTTDRRWLRAIDKAAAKLTAGELIVTLLAQDALVTSENGSYRVNGHCCCKAAQHGDPKCYHRAAVRLIEMMEAAPAASLIEEIETRWTERFAARGYRLGDWLYKRFGTDNLNELKGWLPQIRAALA
jgi:hypothetical protein